MLNVLCISERISLKKKFIRIFNLENNKSSVRRMNSRKIYFRRKNLFLNPLFVNKRRCPNFDENCGRSRKILRSSGNAGTKECNCQFVAIGRPAKRDYGTRKVRRCKSSSLNIHICLTRSLIYRCMWPPKGGHTALLKIGSSHRRQDGQL